MGQNQEVPSDAAVMLPVLESRAGLAMTSVLLTEYGDIDTYAMVAASVDEGMRRLTAVGGDPDEVGGLDNFCWPTIQYHPTDNPDGRYKAAQLVRACWALKDACLALELPLLSGKDSMYVDGTLTGKRGIKRRVSGPPTMMFTATAPVPDLKRVQTLEPKMPGDEVYVLGLTKDELGGSAFYNMLGYVGLNVPQTDFVVSKRTCRALSQALERGLLASACVVSRGGLGYALCKMALAANLGMDLDLDALETEACPDALKKLFSESTGRLVITAAPENREQIQEVFRGVSLSLVGCVTKDKRLVIKQNGLDRVDLKTSRLRKAFTQRFGKLI